MSVKSKASEKKPVKAKSAKPSTTVSGPQLFRVTLEVTDLERAKKFYEELLGIKGKTVQGTSLYFDCGGTVLQIEDVSASGPAHPCARSIYFSVSSVDAVHKRARKLKCLSLELVQNKAGGAVFVRPWGEKCFYADDPWFNSICFVQSGTELKP